MKMDLMQFLTYCTLKDLVAHKMEVPAEKRSYDVEADAHYKVKIVNDNYQLDLLYAVVGDQSVIISGNLYKHFPAAHEIWPQPDVGDMVRAFCK